MNCYYQLQLILLLLNCLQIVGLHNWTHLRKNFVELDTKHKVDSELISVQVVSTGKNAFEMRNVQADRGNKDSEKG